LQLGGQHSHFFRLRKVQRHLMRTPAMAYFKAKPTLSPAQYNRRTIRSRFQFGQHIRLAMQQTRSEQGK